MKSKLALSLFFSGAVALVACSSAPSEETRIPHGSDKVSFGQIANCVADIFNGQSIGIATKTEKKNRNRRLPSANALDHPEDYEKNYLAGHFGRDVGRHDSRKNHL